MSESFLKIVPMLAYRRKQVNKKQGKNPLKNQQLRAIWQKYSLGEKRGIFMASLIMLLIFMLDVYFWILIAAVLVSWLVVFNVINPRHKGVGMICELLNRMTNPVLAQIRRFVPPIGGIDISPIIIIFGIYFLQKLLYSLLWAGQ